MPRRLGSGCITCRIRRVKCDEQKPHCQRCLSTGRRCDGYASPESNASRRELAAQARQSSNQHHNTPSFALAQTPAALNPGKLISSQHPTREYQLFDRFRAIAAQSTALWTDSNFWTVDVLQHAHSQPAIWQGCLALAALNWAWQKRTTYLIDDDVPNVRHQNLTPVLLDEAANHYRNAMRLAQDMRDPAQALILTLVLSATTSMVGDLGESRLHLAAGRRILRELGPRKSMKSAMETLVRLDFDAMSVGDINAPYEPLDLPELRYDAAAVDTIMDYEQAIDCMHRIIRGCMLLGEMTPGPVQPTTAAHLMATIRQWEKRMALLEWGKASYFSPESRQYAPMLVTRVYHALLLIAMLMSGGGQEMRYDDYTDLFIRHILLIEEMIRHSKGMARSSAMEAGLVTSLFVTGSRCRHPWIRRRAIKLLGNLNRQEGLWRSDAVAEAVRRLMEIEELAYAAQSAGAGAQCVKDKEKYAKMDENSYLGESLCERLQREIHRPWEYWSEPDALVSSDEHWKDTVQIPEQCRVKGIQTSISHETQRLHMSVFMDVGTDGQPLQIHEINIPF